MNEVFFMYSQKDVDSYYPNKAINLPEGCRNPGSKQPHYVICNADTGEIFTTTRWVEKPEDYRFDDAQVVAHFKRASAVFFEYPSGVNKPEIFEKELASLSGDEQRARVRTAFEAYAPTPA